MSPSESLLQRHRAAARGKAARAIWVLPCNRSPRAPVISVVRAFVGHGIGKKLHEEPPVPNYGEPERGLRLKEGMVLAIEPMVNVGGYEVEIKEDGWTAVTKDGSLAAHFEHSVAITKDGPYILSQL